MHAHIYARAYARSIIYTRMQFAQTNGLTMRTRVYIINASNAMPKPYLYTYVRAYTRTYAHAVDRKQYSQTNANARTQTHANANERIANSSLRLMRGRFLRANAFDLKLSGCTIYIYIYITIVCTILSKFYS